MDRYVYSEPLILTPCITPMVARSDGDTCLGMFLWPAGAGAGAGDVVGDN